MACGEPGTTPEPTPAWQRGLPAASTMFDQRGLRAVRSIVHLHSPFSHDACDGMPRDATTHAVNESCLADLRRALCETRVDLAALSDHDDSMADEDFATLLLARGADQLVMDDSGNAVASRMTCPDGHVVTFTVGSENPIMPLLLARHVPGTVAQRHDIYNADTPAAMTAFRDAGGLAWIAHTEQRSRAELATLAPDGIEIYQLHANIDPDIRRDYLGLSEAGGIQAVVRFADLTDTGPEPDTALLGFVQPNTPSLARWDEMLGEGKRVSGTAGSDAHQNVFSNLMRDGERGDSYRRVMRWFSNVVLVPATQAAPLDVAAARNALHDGHVMTVFEVFGTPLGFDMQALGAAAHAEMGDVIAASETPTLMITLPTPPTVAGVAAEVSAVVFRVDASGRHEVARGAGPVLSVDARLPGAYRAEVHIVPGHLAAYLGDVPGNLQAKDFVWIYTNPIYVR